MARHTYRYDPLDRLAGTEGLCAGARRLPGFNGELPDPLTGHYLLGHGYRAYNPVLMRFNSPDNLSPFDEGGINAYAYCRGDPVNRSDPDGHADTEQVLSFVWIALGLAGAGWGVKVAMPRIRKIKAGTATLDDILAGAGALGAVAASSVFTASRIIKAVEPESEVPKWMLLGAIALGAPALGMRVLADPGVRQLAARPTAVMRRFLRPRTAQVAGQPLAEMSLQANLIRGRVDTRGSLV